MKPDRSVDSRLLSAAGRQLIVFTLVSLLAVAVLMFALNWLAGLTSSAAGGSRAAVDIETNTITTYLRDEPPQMNSMIATDSVSGMILNHVMEGLLRNDQG